MDDAAILCEYRILISAHALNESQGESRSDELEASLATGASRGPREGDIWQNLLVDRDFAPPQYSLCFQGEMILTNQLGRRHPFSTIRLYRERQTQEQGRCSS